MHLGERQFGGLFTRRSLKSPSPPLRLISSANRRTCSPHIDLAGKAACVLLLGMTHSVQSPCVLPLTALTLPWPNDHIGRCIGSQKKQNLRNKALMPTLVDCNIGKIMFIGRTRRSGALTRPPVSAAYTRCNTRRIYHFVRNC